jgi:hypothetical protein
MSKGPSTKDSALVSDGVFFLEPNTFLTFLKSFVIEIALFGAAPAMDDVV